MKSSRIITYETKQGQRTKHIVTIIQLLIFYILVRKIKINITSMLLLGNLTTTLQPCWKFISLASLLHIYFSYVLSCQASILSPHFVRVYGLGLNSSIISPQCMRLPHSGSPWKVFWSSHINLLESQQYILLRQDS